MTGSSWALSPLRTNIGRVITVYLKNRKIFKGRIYNPKEVDYLSTPKYLTLDVTALDSDDPVVIFVDINEIVAIEGYTKSKAEPPPAKT